MVFSHSLTRLYWQWCGNKSWAFLLLNDRSFNSFFIEICCKWKSQNVCILMTNIDKRMKYLEKGVVLYFEMLDIGVNNYTSHSGVDTLVCSLPMVR